MISNQELINGLWGALRLAIRDTTGYRYFDTSWGGFWRSFSAAVISIPAYVIVTVVRSGSAQVDASAFLLIEAVAYVVGWFAFPFAMLYVVDMIDRRNHYITFIVAANWATAIQLTLISFIAALGAVGLLPEGITGFLTLVATIWILSFQWFVARTALDTNAVVAVAIVLLDLVIGLVVAGIAATIEG